MSTDSKNSVRMVFTSKELLASLLPAVNLITFLLGIIKFLICYKKEGEYCQAIPHHEDDAKWSRVTPVITLPNSWFCEWFFLHDFSIYLAGTKVHHFFEMQTFFEFFFKIFFRSNFLEFFSFSFFLFFLYKCILTKNTN